MPKSTGATGERVGSSLAACPDGALLVGAPGSGKVYLGARGAVTQLPTPGVADAGVSVSCSVGWTLVGGAGRVQAQNRGSLALSDVTFPPTQGLGTQVFAGERLGQPYFAVLDTDGLGKVRTGVLPQSGQQGLSFSSIQGVNSFAAGDLDGDGLDDLALSAGPGDMGLVYLQRRDGGFDVPFDITPMQFHPNRDAVLAIGVLEPQSDRADLLIGSPSTGAVYRWPLRAGAPPQLVTFADDATMPSRFGSALAIGDWDGDGTPEVFVGNALSGEVRSFQLQPDGGVTEGTAFAQDPQLGSGVASGFGAALALVDAEGTGQLSLVVGAPRLSSLMDPNDTDNGAVFVFPGKVRDGGSATPDAGSAPDAGSLGPCLTLPENAPCTGRCGAPGACRQGQCATDPIVCGAGQVCHPVQDVCVAAPTPQFSAQPEQGPAPLLVGFEAKASAVLPLEFKWEFGDGAVGLGRTPTHTYAAPGEYLARLTVYVAGTAASFVSTPTSIRVTPRLPLLGPPPPPVSCGQTFDLVPDAGTPVTWSLGGTRPAGLEFNEATGAIHWVATAGGPWKLTLKATTPDGASATLEFELKPNCSLSYGACGCASPGVGGFAWVALLWARRRRERG